MRVPILILLSVATLLGACGAKQHDARLLSIEEIIEEHPDSALALIGRTDSLSINSRADIALYGLLYVQARTKCDYTECTDTLIAPAIAYFREKGDKERLMKALFYGATTAYNRRELNEAVVRGMESHDIAASLNDLYWRAKAAELIGSIFNSSFLPEQEIEFSHEAAIYYKRAGKELNHLYSLCDYASALDDIGNNKEYRKITDSVMSIAAESHKDSMLYTYIGAMRFMNAMRKNDIATAKEYKNLACTHQSKRPELPLQSDILRYEIISGNSTDIESRLDSLRHSITTNKDSAVVTLCYKIMYKQQGDYEKALSCTEDLLKMQNKELHTLFRQSAIVAQRDMFKSQALIERERSTRNLYILILTLALTAVLIVWGINRYRLRIRLKNAELERSIGRLLNLQCNLNSANTLTQQSRLCVVQAYSSHWTTLRKISDQMQGMPDKYTGYNSIMKQIKNDMEEISSSQKVAEIVAHIDTLHDGVISRMRAEITAMTDTDATIAAMMLAHIDVPTMALILNIKQNTLYSRRRRFMESAAGSDALEAFKSHLAAAE